MVSPEAGGMIDGARVGLMLREGKKFEDRREIDAGDGWRKLLERPYHSLRTSRKVSTLSYRSLHLPEKPITHPNPLSTLTLTSSSRL